MTAARELVSSGPGPVGAPEPQRVRAPAAGSGLSPASANRALARALADAAASRTLGLGDDGAARRTLARCPGCGGTCGGGCGHARAGLDEELLASGQRALRRAVLARRRAVNPRS
jgi:hypothetical protein